MRVPDAILWGHPRRVITLFPCSDGETLLHAVPRTKPLPSLVALRVSPSDRSTDYRTEREHESVERSPYTTMQNLLYLPAVTVLYVRTRSCWYILGDPGMPFDRTWKNGVQASCGRLLRFPGVTQVETGKSEKCWCIHWIVFSIRLFIRFAARERTCNIGSTGSLLEDRWCFGLISGLGRFSVGSWLLKREIRFMHMFSWR